LNQDAINAVINWAFTLNEFDGKLRDAFRLDEDQPTETVHETFRRFVEQWTSGERFVVIAEELSLDVDTILRVYSLAFQYAFQTVVEQGIAILNEIHESADETLPDSVKLLPEYFRHGVPNNSALRFAMKGLRHRRAYIDLGNHFPDNSRRVFRLALSELTRNYDSWLEIWGRLVLENTRDDLKAIIAA